MKSPQKSYLRVLTELEALTQVLSWFDQFNQSSVPYAVWLQCQLALAEGFTNAVRHAHKDQPLSTPIDIEVTQLERALEIRIWDQGQAFDLSQALQQMPQESAKDAEGGRGLRLMQQLADVVSYSRTSDHRNCLLMIKKY